MNFDRTAIQFSQSNQVRNNTGMSLADAEKNRKMMEIGEGKGLSFSFIEGEKILFPKPEEAFPYTKKFRDTDLLYITGYSDKRGRFVEIPISTFRKRPVGEGELERIYDETVNSLNCRLAEASNDLARFRILCEVGCIECSSIEECHAWIFERDEKGEYKRTDKMKSLNVALVRAIEESQNTAA